MLRSFLRRFWWVFLALPLLAAGAFVAWASSTAPVMTEALAAMQSDGEVLVQDAAELVFRPAQTAPQTGLILYPGGRVDPRAYAPQAHAFAADGLLVIIPTMPLNLAVLAPNRAQEIIAAYPQIKTWIIGGHSLGGAMAANFVNHHPQAVQGLFFWAAFPAGNDDLSATTIPVISIYASQDGLASVDEINASAARLPADAMFKRIEGGNHAQFGWYGEQAGDLPATISRQEQQAQLLQWMRTFIALLSSTGSSPVIRGNGFSPIPPALCPAGKGGKGDDAPFCGASSSSPRPLRGGAGGGVNNHGYMRRYPLTGMAK